MEMTKICLLALVALSSSGPAMASLSTLEGVVEHETDQETRIAELEQTLDILVQNQKTTINLALNKEASQSSTWAPDVVRASAEHAVDGNTNGDWIHASCTATNREATPWWQVNFGEKVYFKRIVLTNRRDCCGARLSNFDVKVSDDGESWETVATYPGTGVNGKSISITLEEMAFARGLRIQLKGTDILTLCEVQVFTF